MISKIISSGKRRIRKLWEHLDFLLMKYLSINPWTSSLYYALFNRSFDREHQAMLTGMLKFKETQLNNKRFTSSILRRNIHRLEKGILSRPRRELFALGYISETFAFFKKELSLSPENRISSEKELSWAKDVLEEYFNITKSHPKIDPLRTDFQKLSLSSTNFKNGKLKRPYLRKLNAPIPVKYENLLELAWRRRSVRWFTEEKVPRELINKAMEIATLAPSACNRQPFVFKVFDEPQLVRSVSALPGGTKGFDHQFPVIIAIVGELRNYYGERDKHLIYIDASLAAMSFVFAAETLGLGTCCINWPDIEQDEVRAENLLKLEKDQRPVMFLAVGFPDPTGLVAYSQKKPISQICQYNNQ